MLRVIAAASAPSASIHFASGLTPASASTVAKETPVHSQQLSRPCVSCAVSSGLRRAPVLCVAGTFEEVDPRHGWKSRQIVHGENERPVDQSMHHQPVLRRIDRRNPRMVALIMQAVRGDDSVQVLERRQAERRQPASRFGRAVAITAHDVGFELGRPPIRLAQRLHAGFELPIRDRGRQVVALLRERGAGNDRRSRRACARSEQAPSGKAAAVAILWRRARSGTVLRASAGSFVHSLPLRPPTGGRCVQSSPRSSGQTRA